MLLADRTDGRACATMLRPSVVVVCDVYVLWLKTRKNVLKCTIVKPILEKKILEGMAGTTPSLDQPSALASLVSYTLFSPFRRPCTR